jgi:hypothetical protein
MVGLRRMKNSLYDLLSLRLEASSIHSANQVQANVQALEPRPDCGVPSHL